MCTSGNSRGIAREGEGERKYEGERGTSGGVGGGLGEGRPRVGARSPTNIPFKMLTGILGALKLCVARRGRRIDGDSKPLQASLGKPFGFGGFVVGF